MLRRRSVDQNAIGWMHDMREERCSYNPLKDGLSKSRACGLQFMLALTNAA